MDVVQQILALVLSRRYEISEHALASMDDDDLIWNDVLACLARGRLRRAWPRQKKYEIEGPRVYGTRARFVGRLPRRPAHSYHYRV